MSADEVNAIRQTIIENGNKKYAQAMNELVTKFISEINIDDLRNNLRKQIMDNPFVDSFTIRLNMSLNSVIKHKYNIVDGKLEEENDLYEVHFLNISGNLMHIVLHSSMDYKTQYEDYLYTTDPAIQMLRSYVKEKFPEAQIQPFVYLHSGDRQYFEVMITYTYPVPESLRKNLQIVQIPFRKSQGDLPEW